MLKTISLFSTTNYDKLKTLISESWITTLKMKSVTHNFKNFDEEKEWILMIIFHLTLGNKSKGHFMNKSLLLVHNKNAAEVLTWLPGPQCTCRWIWRYSFRISKLDLETIMMMLIMAHWHIVHIFTKYPFRIHHSTSPLTWRPCRPGPRWTCAACPRCWGRWCSRSWRRPCSRGSRVSSPGHQKDISTRRSAPSCTCYSPRGVFPAGTWRPAWWGRGGTPPPSGGQPSWRGAGQHHRAR